MKHEDIWLVTLDPTAGYEQQDSLSSRLPYCVQRSHEDARRSAHYLGREFRAPSGFRCSSGGGGHAEKRRHPLRPAPHPRPWRSERLAFRKVPDPIICSLGSLLSSLRQHGQLENNFPRKTTTRAPQFQFSHAALCADAPAYASIQFRSALRHFGSDSQLAPQLLKLNTGSLWRASQLSGNQVPITAKSTFRHSPIIDAPSHVFRIAGIVGDFVLRRIHRTLPPVGALAVPMILRIETTPGSRMRSIGRCFNLANRPWIPDRVEWRQHVRCARV